MARYVADFTLSLVGVYSKKKLGAPAHAAKALTHPRWEDYDYQYLDGATNRFYWLGDGNTMADIDPTQDSKKTPVFQCNH